MYSISVTKIKEITMDRQKAQMVRSLVEKEFSKILKKHGLSIEMGTARYTDTCLSAKITIVDGDGDSTNKKSFETDRAYLAGFKIGGENPAGKIFKAPSGREFEIVRFDGRKKKYPVICKCMADGKSYKFAAKTVISGIEA
jgi:hypothetical protein